MDQRTDREIEKRRDEVREEVGEEMLDLSET